jgi:hypothetical protein
MMPVKTEDPTDPFAIPKIAPEAEAEFRQVVDRLLEGFPYLRAEWDRLPAGPTPGGHPILRLFGPAENGPWLCLTLTGAEPGVVIVRLFFPDEDGWQTVAVDLFEDLEEIFTDFARHHFGGTDDE